MKKWKMACSLLIIICLIGLSVSCDGDINETIEGEEAQMAFDAYRELIDSLNQDGILPGISYSYENAETVIDFDDVDVTVESLRCTCNGSWIYEKDNSSVLSLSISADESDGKIILAINFDEESEIDSFKINDIDHTDDFLEYLNSIPIISTITYYSFNHDSGDSPPPQTKQRDESITIADNTGNLQRENYTFSGWYCYGPYTAYAPGELYSIDEDLNLYANWTEIPTYQISYSANGGNESEAPDSQTKHEGDSVIIATRPSSMIRPGYSFTGWVDGSGVSYPGGSSYSADENLTLYAQWHEIGYASEEDHPIITGFSVDRTQVSTCDDEHFVHFTVSATAPVGDLIYAKVYISKPKDVPVGSYSSISTFYYISSAYPYYPDEVGFDGSTSAGTFKLAISTSSLNYKGNWEVILIEVASEVGEGIQNKTEMHHAELIEKGWNFTINQSSSDAL